MEPDNAHEFFEEDLHNMLSAAEEALSETRNPPLSWAYFIVQAALFAGICIIQLTPSVIANILTTVTALTIIMVSFVGWYMRSASRILGPPNLGTFRYFFSMLVTVGVSGACAWIFGLPWLWIVAATCAAVLTMETGRRYRKKFFTSPLQRK